MKRTIYCFIVLLFSILGSFYSVNAQELEKTYIGPSITYEVNEKGGVSLSGVGVNNIYRGVVYNEVIILLKYKDITRETKV